MRIQGGSVLLLVLVLGCQPQRSEVRSDIASVAYIVDEDIKSGATDVPGTYPAEKLVVRIGPPEQDLGVLEFREFLSRSSWVGGGSADDKITTIYREYCRFRGQSYASEWRESGDFLSLRIWLYRWSDPEDATVVIDGGTRITHKRLVSSYFLVRDGQVLHAGSIWRLK